MSIEGTWELTIATPIGKQHATVEIVSEGAAFGGVARSDDEELPLEQLVVDENHMTWTVRMTKPFPLHVTFDVTADGEEMSGHSKAGHFPRSTVTGQRVPK